MATFQTLPPELHLLIFQIAILSQSSPKTHTIHPISPSNTPLQITQISNQPIPTLLHTTHLTRSLFLSLHPLSLRFAYGTFINFTHDTIYLAHCPSPLTMDASGCGYLDGFEVCKALARSEFAPFVKKIAVDERFWVRESQLGRSMAVETWGLVVGGMKGLEEMVVVFGEKGDDGEKKFEGEKKWEGAGIYGDGWVGGRQRKCDDFLKRYLGHYTGEKRGGGMRIRYVVER